MAAITITDLNNAKLDVDHIAAIATSTSATATDRLGGVKPTIKGATDNLAADVAEVEALRITSRAAMDADVAEVEARKNSAISVDIPVAIETVKAFNIRGAWATATAYAIKDLVSVSGSWYVCVVAHTGSAAFATDTASKWRLYQGVTSGDLAASSGASLVGYLPAGTGAVATDVQSKLRESVSVMDFGAVGDGVTDDTAAIQAACNAASAGDTVGFPYAAVGYKIADQITVPAGVSLRGPGKVLRTHGLAVSGYAFTLAGANTVEGLLYDGGALTIGAPGSPLSIKDFNCVGSNVSFFGNTFTNSCGSFINFADDQYAITATISGLVVQGNSFGDYLDHSIYCQGYKLVETGDIAISGNAFIGTAATTTRQAVKLKNINRASVCGNSFNLPNGIFVVVETGLDAPLEARDCQDVVVTGNTGKAFRFLESVADVAALNRAYKVKNLSVTGNTATCTGDYLGFGLVPAVGATYATRLENVTVTGNNFVGRHIVVNGDVNGVNNGITNLVITQNTMRTISGDTVIRSYGNIESMVFNGNVLTMDTAYDAANAILNRKACCDFPLLPTIAGFFDISENVLLGNFGSLISEQPLGANTSINFTCTLRNNKNLGTGTSKRVAVLTSSVIGSATGVIFAERNQSFNGAESSSACSNKALLLETDASKTYVNPASTSVKQFGHYATYICSADLGFNPLALAAGVYYQAYRKGDGSYVRVA